MEEQSQTNHNNFININTILKKSSRRYFEGEVKAEGGTVSLVELLKHARRLSRLNIHFASH